MLWGAWFQGNRGAAISGVFLPAALGYAGSLSYCCMQIRTRATLDLRGLGGSCRGYGEL